MTGDVVGLEALLALRELGVGIEIDDFGRAIRRSATCAGCRSTRSRWTSR